MNISIVNYRHKDSLPLKSIMHLPKSEAFQVAEKLYSQSQCVAHRRFGSDFPSYYEYRLKIEELLYNNFIKLGGKPKIKHPFYFAVQYSDSFYNYFDGGEKITLDLHTIDSSHISFCFGDSMAQMEKNNGISLFTKDELYSNIGSFNDNIYGFVDDINNKFHCIEAQLWTDEYFKEVIHD